MLYMKLNIKTKILLNSILSVVISIVLVTVIISVLFWEQSKKSARQQIRHAFKVTALQIQEMETELRAIAINISNHQDYANKAHFIQENQTNPVLQDMMAGERRELAEMLYEVVITNNIPFLILYDATGEWRCTLFVYKANAYLRVRHLSDEEKEKIEQAIVPVGKQPRHEAWHFISSEILQRERARVWKRSYPLPLPSEPYNEREIHGTKLGLTAVSPLQVRILNPETLKEEVRQIGLIQVFRYLDSSFIQKISLLTDTRLNLFAEDQLSVGNLTDYARLKKEDFQNLLTMNTITDSPDSINILYKAIQIDKEVFFEGLVPFFGKVKVIGAFSVLLSQEEMRKARWQMIRSLVMVALMAVVIVIPLTWFLAIKEIVARERIEKELAKYREHLEDLVQERTVALENANDELEQKNIRLNQTLQKIEEVNKEMTENLQYAKTIQKSLLTDPDMIRSYLPESFFIWLPKDIVGGDIFYTDIFENGFIIAVIDCTGHGVPGAFMTMIASSALRKITQTGDCHEPAEILKQLNHLVRTTLQQDTDYGLSDDGMDAAICFVSPEQKTLWYAGAKVPLMYVYQGELTVIKGDKQSIGYKNSDPDFAFTTHAIPLKKGSLFYMATDGYTDQLGGERGIRFGTGRLKELLREKSCLPFEAQQDILIQTFHEYRGFHDIQDDVTIVGFGFY